MGDSDDEGSTKPTIPLSRSRVNFAVDPVEDPHLHLQHPHSSRGMLRQRSKSSFGKMYSELSPEDGDADHPSSPVGFMWPSSTKSSAQHLENINITFHPSASQPGLLVNETQDVETGAAESSTGGMGGLSFFKSLSSRRNRSRPRLTVRVDPLTSPVESKEEPTTHLSRTPDIEEVKKKLYAQGFLPRTPKSMRLPNSLDPRILLLTAVIVVLTLALIIVSTLRVRSFATTSTTRIEERITRIEEAERRSRRPSDALMPNLFVEMLGVGESDVDQKLRAAWNHIFRGDPVDEAVYFEVKNGMAYVMNTEGDFVTSEGMSYGMMITAQLGKKAELDRLWLWTKTYMMNKAGDHKGLLAWKLATDGTIQDPMPAPDADTYVATALLIAHSKWGSPSDQSYLTAARKLISDMGDPKNGLFNAQAEVVFAPNSWGRNHSNPSYHLPAMYEMWARVYEIEEIPGAAFWHKAARTSRLFLKRACSTGTGLAPDYTYLTGAAAQDENGHGYFQYDAWRVGANIAMDWAWWGRDAWQRAHADTLQNFFMTKGIKTYTSIYSLQGDTLNKGNEHSVGLIAMNAVSSLAATKRGTAAAFVEELWNADLPTGKWRYYGAMLYFMGMLHVSGRFRPAC